MTGPFNYINGPVWLIKSKYKTRCLEFSFGDSSYIIAIEDAMNREEINYENETS